MMEDVLSWTILRLRQSRRMQEPCRAVRKLEASGATALRRTRNQELRRSPMTGNSHRSVHRLLP
jgi:hypothetical protein